MRIMIRVWGIGSKLLKRGSISQKIIRGSILEVIEGDTRSLDYCPDKLL